LSAEDQRMQRVQFSIFNSQFLIADGTTCLAGADPCDVIQNSKLRIKNFPRLDSR
jgi:hypothetical protein